MSCEHRIYVGKIEFQNHLSVFSHSLLSGNDCYIGTGYVNDLLDNQRVPGTDDEMESVTSYQACLLLWDELCYKPASHLPE